MRPVDLDKLRAVVSPVVEGNAYELVDLEWKHEAGSWILRVYIDHVGDRPVSLEDCTRVSRELSPVLDVADLIGVQYSLEVSSPGLNRPLRGEEQFRRFIGHKAKIRTRSPVGENRRNFAGRLVAVDNGTVRIDVGDQVFDLPVAEVEKANLVYDFSGSK